MVTCMCTWMLKCLCACIFNALLITCSHMYLLWKSLAHMSTFLDDHMLLCSHVLIFTHFSNHMLWLSYTPMSTCFDKNMSSCLYASMLICLDTFMDVPMLTCFVDHMYLNSHAMMIECFHVYMLWWSHGHLTVCLRFHLPGHFNDYLLLFWNASMFDTYMHWYLHIWYPHTYAHTWMIKCQLAQRLKWMCSTMFVHSNVLKIMLECWDDQEIRGMYTWVL